MDMSTWGVLGASVMINVLVKGTLKSIGVLMVELDEMGVSTTEAAWIPAIAYTLFACLSSPVARLVELTSSRLVSILGGLLLSLGVLLASMGGLPQLYLGLGVALGAGGCMATLPGVLEINKRFQDTGRRGLVHGVSLAGNTVGGLLLPAIIARLVSSLDYQRALIVHSGLLLNILAAALLYHPSSTSSTTGHKKGSSASVLKNGRLWCCIFATASTCVGYTNFGLYLPLHLHTVHGLSSTEAAIFISVFSAGDLIGRILGPALSDLFATSTAPSSPSMPSTTEAPITSSEDSTTPLIQAIPSKAPSIQGPLTSSEDSTSPLIQEIPSTTTPSSRWLWYCSGLVGSGCAILLVPLLSLPQLGLCGSLSVSLGGLVFIAGLFSGVWCGVYPALLSDELGQDNLHISYPISQTVAGIINLGVPPSLAVLVSVADTGFVMCVLGGTLVLGAAPLTVSSILRGRSG